MPPTLADIRLGWIERFRAVVDHGCFIEAGQACGIDPTSVWDSVRKLELALRRPLLIPGHARATAFGKSFMRLSTKPKSLIRLFQSRPINITLEAFEVLQALIEHGSYIAVQEARQLDRFRMMRLISKLESAFGKQLVLKDRPAKLTTEGEIVLEAFTAVIEQLSAFRGPPHPSWEKDFSRKRVRPWWVRVLDANQQKAGKQPPTADVRESLLS